MITSDECRLSSGLFRKWKSTGQDARSPARDDVRTAFYPHQSEDIVLSLRE
jgi:hypothetical protein